MKRPITDSFYAELGPLQHHGRMPRTMTEAFGPYQRNALPIERGTWGFMDVITFFVDWWM